MSEPDILDRLDGINTREEATQWCADASIEIKRLRAALNVRVGDAYGVKAPQVLGEHSDGDINYAVIAACKDNSSHLNHGAVSTWADLIRALARQLDKWIDQDGYNVRIISITATRELIYQKRSGPV